MTRRPTMPLLFVTGLLLLSACEWMQPRVDHPLSEDVRVPPPHPDSLRAAPETVTVGELRVAANATLWINRMPGPEIEDLDDQPGDPLQGHFDIHSVDDRSLPRGLRLQGAWVLATDSVWAIAVAPSDTSRAGSPWIVRRVHGVPAWPRGDTAEVIVRMGLPDGRSQLVRTRSVPVTVEE